MKLKGTYYFIFCIALGLLMGKFILDQYSIEEKTDEVNKTTNTVYFIEEGSYNSLKELEEKITNVEYYIYSKIEDKYYAYLGMTLKEENVTKLQEYFKNIGYETKIKTFTIDKMAFLEILGQYDMMLEGTDDKNTISAICSQVLSKYEEIVLSDQD